MKEYIEAKRTDGDTVWMDGRDTWIQVDLDGEWVCLDGEFTPMDLRIIAEFLEEYRESKRRNNAYYQLMKILTNIDQLKTKEERIATLLKYKHPAIEAILRGAYDPEIKWALPEGSVPYRASGAIDQQGMLYTEYKRFYIFVEGSCPNLRQARRELLFVQFLESLHPGDAAMMEKVKDKQLPYPNITPELVDEVFPGLLGNWKKEIKPMPPAPWQKGPQENWNVDVCEVKPSLPKEKKPKKPLTEKQKIALKKAQDGRRAQIAAQKAAQGK